MFRLPIIFVLILIVSGCNLVKDEEQIREQEIILLFDRSNDVNISGERRKLMTDTLLDLIPADMTSYHSRSRLFKVANRYYNLREFLQFKKVSQRILNECLQVNDTVNLGKAYSYMGDYYQVIQHSDSALFYYYNAKKFFLNTKRREEVAEVLLQIAILKINENDWRGAENHAIESLTIFKEAKNSLKISSVYNILGAISHNLDDHILAISMYQRAIAEFSENKDNKHMCQLEIIKHNLATVYLEQGNYEVAHKLYRSILNDTLFANLPDLYASTLSHYANSTSKLFPQDENVVEMHRRAVFLSDSLFVPISSVVTRYKLAEYYITEHDSLNARKVASEALVLARPLNDKVLTIKSLKQLILADPKNASKYSKEYIALNDSLQIAERQMQNKFARIEFETDQMKIERDNAIFDNSIFLTLFLIFSILISGVLYFAYKRTGWSQARDFKFRQKLDSEIFYLVSQQQQKVMEGRQYEKARISRELHDGVLNDLSFVRNSLAYVIGKGEFASTFNGFQKYLDRLQLIEREIHTISHDLKGKTILHGHSFRKIVDELFEHQHTTTPIEWTFSHDETIRWKYVNSQLKINIYRILQELIQNVNRHSYAKYATVNILRINDKIEITVFDDGRGFTSKNQNTGTGLNNMRERMLLNGGSISVESGYKMGVKIILEFPY